MPLITHVLQPDEIERRVADALGDEIGRYRDAWHILQPDDLAALILFRHTTVSLADVYHLCRLLLTSAILNGYLVTLTPPPEDVIQAATAIGILLITPAGVEQLLLQQFQEEL